MLCSYVRTGTTGADTGPKHRSDEADPGSNPVSATSLVLRQFLSLKNGNGNDSTHFIGL